MLGAQTQWKQMHIVSQMSNFKREDVDRFIITISPLLFTFPQNNFSGVYVYMNIYILSVSIVSLIIRVGL